MSEEEKAKIGQEYVNLSNELNQEVVDLLAQIPEAERAEIYRQACEEYLAPDSELTKADIIRKKIEESKQGLRM